MTEDPLLDRVAAKQAVLVEAGRWAGATPFGAVALRDGVVIAEHYAGPFGPEQCFEIGSLRKSVFSALLGQSLVRGHVLLDQNASALWPDLTALSGNEKDQAITLHQLASSVSGWLTPDPPGSQFLYNNAGFTAGEKVLAAALCLPQLNLVAHVEQHVRVPLKAASWRVLQWAKPFDRHRYATPGPKLAIHSTLRDLARWGQVWLNGGWAGSVEIVPGDYVRIATRPTNPHLASSPYGYGFYSNADGTVWPGLPVDAFGHGGFGSFDEGPQSRCFLWVCPSHRIVIAAVGEAGHGIARLASTDNDATEISVMVRSMLDA